MNRLIPPGPLTGTVAIPASKSQAHRLLICAGLGEKPVDIACQGISQDIRATMDCLTALGASVREENGMLLVRPGPRAQAATLPCGESGSTLRFLLPVAAALGCSAVFRMEGRLPQRPLAPLDGQLTAHGVTLERQGDTLLCRGQLTAGAYTLPGNVSSQYISGLLLALPMLDGDSTLTITGTVESAAYIAMTESALLRSGIRFTKEGWVYRIPGRQHFALSGKPEVEGDWSNAAFFLCAGALSTAGVTVTGLDLRSPQGDRAVLDILREMGAVVEAADRGVTVRRGALRGVTIDAGPIPDLIPVLSVVAAAAEGETRVIHAGRLRLKESDRLETTAAMLRALGAAVEVLPDGLVIRGGTLQGGTVDACNDHRIAMAAAVAACACTGSVTVLGSQCVAKSYPRFWEDYDERKGAKL